VFLGYSTESSVRMTIHVALDILQTCLAAAESPHDVRQALQEVIAIEQQCTDIERAQIGTIARLLRALSEDEALGAVGTSDVVVLMRQVLRIVGSRLQVNKTWWRPFSAQAEQSSIYGYERNNDVVELTADPWQPLWLPNSNRIDELELRRQFSPALGDGMLYRVTNSNMKTYLTAGQKEAVDAWLYAAEGTTTLFILPTGGGKSMIPLLTAFVENRGGTYSGGTTLVVVPTVALVHDQLRRAREVFSSQMAQPAMLGAETPTEERAQIYERLKTGNLPLLFLSPEALQQPVMYQVCMEAVRAGNLCRLVIDEAHLVETWGAHFRVHFQFLRTFRHQALVVGGGKLRTALLSATVSSSARTLLTTLFAEPQPLYCISENVLRPEISYWMRFDSDQNVKEQHILEALRHLPRPAILYMTLPTHAEAWVRRLREYEGFRRIAAFTGKSSNNERRSLIRAWANGEIDLMVATSAFGLGVDKSDVRTIIHAAVPESIDRFYQEVGRGGRDGLSSISLLCVTQDDIRLARNMQNKRIKADNAWGRWNTMRRIAKSLGNNKLQINRQTRPDYRMDIEESDMNGLWNDHTLLLMQRVGLIEIESFDFDAESETAESLLTVHIIDPDGVQTENAFTQRLEPIRVVEKRSIKADFDAISSMIRDYARSEPPEQCLSYRLEQPYKPIGRACGGCPSCRHHRRQKTVRSPVRVSQLAPQDVPVPDERLCLHIGSRRQLSLLHDASELIEAPASAKIIRLIEMFIQLGMSQLILPASWLNNPQSDPLWEVMRGDAFRRHRLIDIETLLSQVGFQTLRERSTAVFYPQDKHQASKLHDTLSHWELHNHLWRIDIISSSLFLPTHGGYFTDRVESKQERVDYFLEWARTIRTTL